MTGRRVLRLLAAVALVVAGSSFFGSRPAQAAGGLCVLFNNCPTSTTTPSTTAPPDVTTTTTTTSTTTSPPPPGSTTSTTAPAAGVTSTFDPCQPDPAGACTTEPSDIEIEYRSGAAPAGIEVSWVATGRPPAAPAPSQPTAILTAGSAGPCPAAPAPVAGRSTECWSFPPSLERAGSILDGTYSVVPCTTVSSGSCRTGPGPTDVALGAPPPPPGQPVTTVSDSTAPGATVDVSWPAPASPPPDLAGYSLRREGRVVYTCGLSGLGPAGAPTCPGALHYSDRPGAGSWFYTVSSLRLGSAPAGTPLVASDPGASEVGPVDVGPGGGAPTVVSAAAPRSSAPAASPGRTTPTLAGSQGVAAGSAPSGAPVQSLSYPAGPAPTREVALEQRGPGRRPDPVPTGLLALGVIVLALAAHVLYLRARLGPAATAGSGGDDPDVSEGGAG